MRNNDRFKNAHILGITAVVLQQKYYYNDQERA